MNKQNIAVALKFVAAFMLIYLSIPHMHAAAEVPYYTYTSDSVGHTIKTQAAYTPGAQILEINGQRLEKPEHVFVDHRNYIYITDSKLNKVFILDSNYRFYRELTSDKFSAITSVFVTDQYIYVVDEGSNKIFVFDKPSFTLVQEIGTPDSPIFKEGYEFKPTNIAVDVRGNIYVRSSGSVNGLIMLNRDGEFISFFGANPLKVPIMDRLRSLFLTEAQEEQIQKLMPDLPSDLAVDRKGFIYTVTSSVETNPIKKFNVSGTNYFPDNMVGTLSMDSVWIGQHNNVISVSSDGWIYEYDTNGNLLFTFGGKDFNSVRLGLLSRPVSIASNTSDDLIVVDQGTNLIQIYHSTKFADVVHSAMDAYQDGDYEKSKELWEYTLKYNSLFDKAHIGLGDAFLRKGDAVAAMSEFVDAEYKPGISEAFWEIRQRWLQNNLNVVLSILIAILILGYVHTLLKKRYGYAATIGGKLRIVRRIRIIDDLLYIFRFLKHPLDGFYEIQYENRVSRISSTVIYILVIVMVIALYEYANPLFVPKQEYLYKLSVMVGLAVLWVFSNYLICSISDGEGKFKDVYNATAYSLSPMLVIIPPLILVSNVLTLEQSIFYHLPVQAATIWVAFLMFFMIKDIHGYEVGETVGVVFKSLFTMLVIGLFLFVIYSLGSQLLGFVHDIVTEVINRWS
jgi:hypothetical protein